MDADRHVLALDVPATELELRRLRRGPVKLAAATGYLSIYQRAVQPMSTGAMLVERNVEKAEIERDGE